jgi:sugar fermentation stimulation protein A
VGAVVSRPNRFVMMVRTDDHRIRCHCPTTGRLGDLSLSGLRCLYSDAHTNGRKTAHTVEAISIDRPVRTESWIGINQTAVNRHVEFFIRSGQLSRMAMGVLKREVRLGGSRIDFLVGDTYVEVKTPLTTLPATRTFERVKHGRFDSFGRLIRHMTELREARSFGRRAVIAMCYLYDAKPFRPPASDVTNARVLETARLAEQSGVETWQVNMKLDRKGVRVIRYFRNEISTAST